MTGGRVDPGVMVGQRGSVGVIIERLAVGDGVEVSGVGTSNNVVCRVEVGIGEPVGRLVGLGEGGLVGRRVWLGDGVVVGRRVRLGIGVVVGQGVLVAVRVIVGQGVGVIVPALGVSWVAFAFNLVGSAVGGIPSTTKVPLCFHSLSTKICSSYWPGSHSAGSLGAHSE